MKANKIKRPSPWIYLPLVGLANIYTRLVKRHRFSGGEIIAGVTDGPLLVIGNHTSFYDFLYMARIFYPHRINFVVAAKYFRFKGLAQVFRLAQAIPKNLFSADIRTVSRAASVIRQGGIVGIYPEGQISLGGITLPLPEGMGKLVKHLNVPVVAVKTYGAGFVDPPWSDCHRKGIVESYVSMVLTREQLNTMSLEEIDHALRDALSANPYDWQRANGYEYKGKELSCGLTHILYICPHCNSEFTLTSTDDQFVCSNCGMTTSISGSGHFLWNNTPVYFEHVGQWYLWQQQHEVEAVLAKEDFTYSLPVELAMYRQKGNGIEVVGNGSMTITRASYQYKGTVRDEMVLLNFPTGSVRYVPFDGGRNFQIYEDNQLNEFRPDPGEKSVKAALVGEAMYYLQLKNKEN
jgi:1-acyl-sn-glycerol-3-phosphate acyltransferase